MSVNNPSNNTTGRQLANSCAQEELLLSALSMNSTLPIPGPVLAHTNTCYRCAVLLAQHNQSSREFIDTIGAIFAERGLTPRSLTEAEAEQEEHYASIFFQQPFSIRASLDQMLTAMQTTAHAQGDATFLARIQCLSVEHLFTALSKTGIHISIVDAAQQLDALVKPTAAPPDAPTIAEPAEPVERDVAPIATTYVVYTASPGRLRNVWGTRAPSFRWPDNPQWLDEPGYSFEVGRRIASFYPLLQHTTPLNLKDSDNARVQINVCATHTMSIHQRLCLTYASGLLEIMAGKYEAACQPLDDALEISRRVEEPASRATLANLRGKASYFQQRYRAAAEYFTISVNVMRELNTVRGPNAHIDSALEVESLTPLASCCFFVEEFDHSGQYIDDARRLISPALTDQHSATTADKQGTNAVRKKSAELTWAEALLHRWKGNPEVALRHAMAAAEAFTALKQPVSTGRISTVVADIALDMVESFGDVGMGQPMSLPQQLYAAIAETYVTMATLVLERQADTFGVQLAALTQARFQRVVGKDTDRVRKIGQVIDRALASDDRVLLATAYTTLGDEFRVRGETEPALASYRLTLDTLRETEYPALGIFARRRLMYAAEGLPN